MKSEDLIAIVQNTLAKANIQTTKVLATEVVENMVDAISDTLKGGGEVIIKNFGRLHVKTRAARKTRSIATGEMLDVPEKRVVKFAPRGAMNEL